MDIGNLKARVDLISSTDFETLALDVFRYQSRHCLVYQRFLEHLQTDVANVDNVDDIPYLPIEFFKNFEITTGQFTPALVFESSSTTGLGVSRHCLDTPQRYTDSFVKSFHFAFGDPNQYCHLALLPSYLERQHSSLVYQVDHFIKNSVYSQSAFYLSDMDALHQQLLSNEVAGIPTVLWGVTYALLDMAERYSMQLKHTRIIETGGMKGRRKEITRYELHDILRKAFGVNGIGGEYGMTELLSQAYSSEDGIYRCPPQMRISVREINDPFSQPLVGRHGVVNVCDLSNLQSCAFIATSDLGKAYEDGSFEILGRVDYSDTRGCNLLVI